MQRLTVPEKYSRKRQRRQAAAVVVQSLWNNAGNANAAAAAAGSTNNNAGGSGRKSTAQPRPDVVVPPRGIGPIVDPNQHDVLCGRGGRINSHAGNIQFRDMVQHRKKEYLAKSTKKLEKAHIAAKIVREIRAMDPPGRFLKQDRSTGLWFDIGDQKAFKKAGQALREDAPGFRGENEEDSSGDERAKAAVTPATTKPAVRDKKSVDAPKPSDQPVTVATGAPKPPPPSSSPHNHSTAISRTHDTGDLRCFRQNGKHEASVPYAATSNAVQVSAEDYEAQIAMPPPSFVQTQQVNQQYPHAQPQSRLQSHSHSHSHSQSNRIVRTIPIQAPPTQQVFPMPSQMFGSNRSGGRSVSNASRHAMQLHTEQLPAVNHRHQRPSQPPAIDIAFDKVFFPPRTSSAVSGDHTMSSISGMSEQISSLCFGSGIGANSLSGQSKTHGTDSSRMQHTSIPRISEAGTANRSDLTGSLRSMGSLTRSLSFPDVSSIGDHDSYKAITEGDRDFTPSVMSVSSHRYTLGSRGSAFGLSASAWPRRPSTSDLAGPKVHASETSSQGRGSPLHDGMSISSITSAQWAAAIHAGISNGGGSLTMDDGQSTMSYMSSDFHALDLAGTFR